MCKAESGCPHGPGRCIFQHKQILDASEHLSLGSPVHQLLALSPACSQERRPVFSGAPRPGILYCSLVSLSTFTLGFSLLAVRGLEGDDGSFASDSRKVMTGTCGRAPPVSPVATPLQDPTQPPCSFGAPLMGHVSEPQDRQQSWCCRLGWQTQGARVGVITPTPRVSEKMDPQPDVLWRDGRAGVDPPKSCQMKD